MSILSAIKQQNSSLDDLAALPQVMIMQMAQKKQISEEMLAPILARKAELVDAFARQNALQGAGQPPPTVMEQLMAQNAQAEQPQMPQQLPQQMPQPAPQMAPQMDPSMMPQMDPSMMAQQTMPMDAGLAQLPVPERQYAGGGIIAFADGGLSDEDEDYEDALEEADYDAMIEQAMNAGEDDYNPVFETRQAKGSPQSFPNSGREVGIASVRPERDRAKQDGDIRSRLLSTILQKESGGNRYDKQGNLLTSPKGAEGEMQVMRYTARDPGFGVRPAQNNSPDELKRVGDDYAMAMYNRYRDPKLAMIAYNMGPGATDKWLAAGADPRKLPKETQGYISGVHLAQGGEVRHFKNDGYVGYGEEAEYDPNAPSIYDTIGSMFGNPLERLGSHISGVGFTTEKERAEARKEKKVVPPKMPEELKNAQIGSKPPTAQELRDFDQAAALFEAENMGKNAPVQAQEAPKSGLDQYMERMLAGEKRLEKQRADDKNMALIAAGLGMMGGTSPYAFANIGQGAMAGVQHLSEANKQRAAEQAALDKGMLYAQRYKGAEELNKQNAQFQRGMKQQQYALDVAKHGTEQQKIAINQYETHIKNAMASLDKNSLLLADPAARAAAEDKILNGPTARALYKRAYGDMGMPSQSAPTFTPKQESLLSKYLPK
jgi:hypothetical protein